MRAAKLAKIFADPRNWRAVMHRIAPGVEHRPALSAISPSAVIDVGANKGQFAYLANMLWPNAKLFSFEPLPGPRERYQRLMQGRATVFDCALGEAEGIATMHVASREDSSSLLPLGEQREVFQMDEVQAFDVPVRRLDRVLPDLPAPALLKIDVQGFEYEVLQGATNLFSRIDWIYVEASYVELYQGQRLIGDVQELLESHGYQLTSQHNTAHDKGRLVQADFLFTRRPGPSTDRRA